jgi:hypothetical protein
VVVAVVAGVPVTATVAAVVVVAVVEAEVEAVVRLHRLCSSNLLVVAWRRGATPASDVKVPPLKEESEVDE